MNAFHGTEKATEIVDGVFRAVETCTGRKKDELALNQTLVGDLEIDSIDLMDLIYELERRFKVKIQLGELERQARANTKDAPFEVNHVLTPEGMKSLQALMPEVPAEKWKTGLLYEEIPYLFTLESLCRVVQRKLPTQAPQPSVDV